MLENLNMGTARVSGAGLVRRACFAGASVFALAMTPAFAETTAADIEQMQGHVEEVVVTGSYIRKSVKDTASPVSLIGRDEFAIRALQTADDLVKIIPSNGQSKTYSDAVGSPHTAGTAQINLRGLGLSSTLTLINGRRQTVAPTPDSDGSSFVDINTIPLVMVDRLEVLQDGAAALYGSDAVAGVANFVMRDSFEGLEVRASRQMTTNAQQFDTSVGAVGGLSGDRWNFVAGIEYLDRDPLGQQDRSFSRNKAQSSLGSPGAFAPIGGSPLIDPGCAAAGGTPIKTNPANPAAGYCGMNLSSYFDLIAREWRLNSYATGKYRVTNNVSLYAEGGYAHSRVDIRASPSYIDLKFPIVPVNNPGNLVANGGFGVPVVFFGRPFGNPDAPYTHQPHILDTYRAVVGAKGVLAGTWTFDTSYSYSAQSVHITIPGDLNAERFQAALDCVGGPNNNQCFNPFASAHLNPALANSQSVIDDFMATSIRQYDSSLHAVDAVVTGDLFSLPAGEVAMAIGGQFRHEVLQFASDPLTSAGKLGFQFTGPDFTQGRNIFAGFFELNVPLLESLSAQVAGRYERYSDVGGSFNPKLALRWEALEGLVMRGSVGTSFRAPSLSQVTAISTINTAIADPYNPSTVPFYTDIATVPSSTLADETARNFSLGSVWTPIPELSFSLDYWNYKYKNMVVKQDAQTIVNNNPNDPRIVRVGGPTGLISEIHVSFVNARSVETDGFDFSTNYQLDVGEMGNLYFSGRGTFMNKYMADVGHGLENLVGKRNYQNFAHALPRFKGNATATWKQDVHQVSLSVNYIDSFVENLSNLASPINGFKVNAFTTYDLQYAIDIERWGANLSVGMLNVLDAKPPAVGLTNVELSGFDRQMHDPRGRMLYVKVSKTF